jgi:hypothetical protein
MFMKDLQRLFKIEQSFEMYMLQIFFNSRTFRIIISAIIYRLCEKLFFFLLSFPKFSFSEMRALTN